MARSTGTQRRKQVPRLIQRDGCKCAWCATELTDTKATVDHVLPYSQGGTNRIENLVLSCARCNRARGSLSATSFLARCIAAGMRVRSGVVNQAIRRAGQPSAFRGAPVSAAPQAAFAAAFAAAVT